MAETKNTEKKTSKAKTSSKTKAEEKQIEKTSEKETEKKVPVKQKKEKVETKVSAKKLPGLFKKAYSEKNFKKKIDSKLYVPADKEYVSSLFVQEKDKKGRDILVIPKTSEFKKSEIKRLKALAKDISHNKGRIKLVPLIAVVCFIAAVGIVVTLFKNPVAKWGIRSTMEGIFGAKCDIGDVNIEIFGAQITVTDFAQASSDDPMKNIFQFDKLDLDFNLTELLKAKFDAENIEITGIALGTERTTSGKLAVKKKTAREKEEKTDSTGFYESLKEKTGSNPEAAMASFNELFSTYDPNKIVENIQTNLKTPAAAKEVEETVTALVENWKTKPEEIQKSVDSLKASTQKLTSLNVSGISNAAEIAALLKEIETATSEIKAASDSIQSTMNSFKGDQETVKSLQTKLTDAIASDRSLLETQIEIFDISQIKSVLSGTFDEAAYALVGNYYPYLKQLISYAVQMKASSSAKSESTEKAVKQAKETAKKESKRYEGRYVYWKADKVPRFLIENLHGSGNGIDISATNISSDMDKRGEPWLVNGSFLNKETAHNAKLTVDARTASTVPLVQADYSASNFPFVLNLSKEDGAPGVPSFDGSSVITAKLTADDDFSFGGSASINMNPVTVTAVPLEAEVAQRIYSTALSSIKSLNVGASFDFSASSGIGMKITTNFDTILADAIQTVAQSEFANIKEQATAKIQEQLNSYSAGADSKLANFNGIAEKFTAAQNSVNSISAQIEEKKAALTKQMTASATEKAKSEVTEKASSALKGLFQR